MNTPLSRAVPAVKDCEERLDPAHHTQLLQTVRKKELDRVGAALRMIKTSLSATRNKAPVRATKRLSTAMGHEAIAHACATDSASARGSEIAIHVQPTTSPINPQATVTTVTDPLRAEDLDAMTETMQKMASSAGPVIHDFDEVFVKPHLDEIGVSLDPAPAIGIQGRELLYGKHSIDGQNKSTRVFTSFDSLPSDAPEDLSSVKVFPYNGDTYLAIGTAVWRKDERNADDEALIEVASDWTAVHQPGWQKMGDAVLPADVVDIAVYGEITGYDLKDPASTGNAKVEIRVVLLDAGGKLHLVQGGDGPLTNFESTPLEFDEGGSSQVAPTWELIAFSGGTMYGYEGGVVWILEIDLATGTYTTNTRIVAGEVLEMVGVDVGLVVRLADGLLYQRFVDVSGKDDANFVYDFARSGDAPTGNTVADRMDPGWVNVPDQLRIVGVSSPGAKYTLRSLIGALKSRYLQSQTVLYPAVENIKSFSFVHSFYLDYLRTVSEELAGVAPTSDVALVTGTTHITHLNAWGNIVNNAIEGVKPAMDGVTDDMADVAILITAQVQAIQGELEIIVEEIEDLESQQQAAKNSRIVGIVLLMVTFPLIVAAGYFNQGQLVLSGIIFLVQSGPLIRKLTFDIYELGTLITIATNKADSLVATQDTLTSIAENYDNISTSFSSLQDVWTGISANTALVMGQTDGFRLLGEYLLGADSLATIDAMEIKNKQMGDACTAFLDLINSQGVPITPQALYTYADSTRGFNNGASITLRANVATLRKGGCVPQPKVQVQVDAADFVRAASYSGRLLKTGDASSYIRHLQQTLAPCGQVTATIRDRKIVLARMQ